MQGNTHLVAIHEHGIDVAHSLPTPLRPSLTISFYIGFTSYAHVPAIQGCLDIRNRGIESLIKPIEEQEERLSKEGSEDTSKFKLTRKY
jgi:hypothetical protein